MTGFVRAPRDVAAGLMFTAIGAAALAIGWDYRLGSLLNMGPGYFPRIIGIFVTAMGLLVTLGGLRSQGEELTAWHLRPLLLILVAIGVFGACLERFGLVAAITGLTVIAAYAARERRHLEVLVLAVVLNLIAWGIFVKGLGLPMNVWPEFGS